MKYYRVTAYTMYCGEETTDYIATSDEEKLRNFGLNLAEENALEWEPCWADYEDQGYDSEEDWQEEYFGSANFRVEEITEEEYKKEIAPRWPFELVKKENKMSKLKNFDRALYKSDFDAVVEFVKEGYLPNYDFGVCSAEGFDNVLWYLCTNNIPHTYHRVDAIDSLSLISIVFGDNVEYSYSFWCKLKEEKNVYHM